MGGMGIAVGRFRTDDRQDGPDGGQSYFRLRQQNRQQCCQTQPRDCLAGSASLSNPAGKGHVPTTTEIYKQYEEHSYTIDFYTLNKEIFNTLAS